MAYTGPAAGPQSQHVLGGYRIIREIARSNDIVWEGVDPRMNRRVAVKELALDANLTATARQHRIDRFHREARAAGNLNHPHIVTIYEVGQDRGRYFIAMEYLDGQTLRERLSVGGALPLNDAVSAMASLCDALHYAHQHGVIHRDLKPDNIFLVRPDNRVKVADFGIARITNETQLTAAGQIFGTPSYMSPEQVLGKEIDARSDIFSLGIVLYEMVTGRKPFMGDSVVTITYRIMHEPTPAVLGASPALDSVIQRATAKNPADRYASAAEFRAALLAAAEQYRHTGAATLNGMPLGPLPQSSMPHSTSVYGASTQQNLGGAVSAPVINGPIYDVAQLVGPGPSAPPPFPSMLHQMPPPPEQRNYSALIISLAMFALAVMGGGWALTTALSRASGQVQAAGSADYDKAAMLYGAKRYEEAAPLFKAVRQSPNSNKAMATKAKQGESWCYRALGQRAMEARDYKKAVDWYSLAFVLAPDDVESQKGLQLARQAGNIAATGSTNPADATPAPNAPPETIQVVNNSPENKGNTTPYSGTTRTDWDNAGQQRATNAKAALDEGNQAHQEGRVPDACAAWQRAREIGPGTGPAIQAGQKYQENCQQFPLFNGGSGQ